MTAQGIRRIEDELYRDSESRFFRCGPTPRPDGENLDIPAFMRRGIQIRTTNKSPGVTSTGAKQKN